MKIYVRMYRPCRKITPSNPHVKKFPSVIYIPNHFQNRSYETIFIDPPQVLFYQYMASLALTSGRGSPYRGAYVKNPVDTRSRATYSMGNVALLRHMRHSPTLE